MEEPVLTWNLFLTAILMPLCCVFLGVYLNTQSKKRWAGWEKYNALKEQTERETKLQFEKSLTCIRSHISELATKKMDKTEYEKKNGELWDRVNDHAHTIDCKGHNCTAKETGRVIITGK